MMLPDTRIMCNKAECRTCGDIIESRHRHDYVTCSCSSISIDGGKDYLKRVGNVIVDLIDLSEHERYFRKPYEWSARDEDVEKWMIENGFPLDGNWDIEHYTLYKLTWGDW